MNLLALALLAFLAIAAIFYVPSLPGAPGQYIAIAGLAGLDTILGGIRSGLEGKFYNDVFITGFVSNIVIAFFLSWLGDQIGVNLFLAAALVLGARIFTNLSLIRRFILTKYQDARARRLAQRQSEGSV
ncbi:MAG: small basic family protein [Fimbriimonadaceae bacterium]